ncbi:MAG: hypothetical protein HN849_10460 [Victivallales bacterium]|nr:hypothetical protein [Victivallales bacterium]
MTRHWDIVRNIVLAVVLAVAMLSWSPGAAFSTTGEQLSTGVPLPTVALLLGLLAIFACSPSRPFPLVPWPVAIAVMTASCGLLGAGRAHLPTTLKELIQLGEITLVSIWLVQFGTRRHVRSVCVRVFAVLGVLLLLLGATGQLALVGLSPAKWGAFTAVAAPFVVLVMGRSCPWLAVIPGVLAGLAFGHAGPLLVWCGVVAVSGVLLGRRHLLVLLAVPVAIAISLLPSRPDAWGRLSPGYDATHLKRSVIESKLAGSSPYRLPFGAGFGQYKSAINRLRVYGAQEPHPADRKIPQDGNSQYLVTLVESGVLGFLGFGLMLFLAAVAAFRRQPRDTAGEAGERVCVACAIVALAAASVFAVTVSRGLGIWLGILLGLAFDSTQLPSLRRRLLRVGTCWGTVLLLLGLSLTLNATSSRRWPSRANRLASSLYNVTATTIGPRIVVLQDIYAGNTRNVLTVEAEDASETMAPFTVVRTDGASGEAALAIPEDRGNGRGRATLELQVPAPGRYILFARVFWADGCGNSTAFRIGQQEIRLADDLYRRWHQVEGAVPIELPAGNVLLEVVNLEDGVMLDYVGLRLLEN